jgi:uncharacterized protein with HEPN domain
MWRDEACLLDMLLAARKIRRFSEGVAFEKFLSDELMQHGIMRLIQILGEAARKVSPEFRQAHQEIPWQGIIGMRNRMVHEYFRIIPAKVWDVVRDEIPALIPLLEPLVPPAGDDRLPES